MNTTQVNKELYFSSRPQENTDIPVFLPSDLKTHFEKMYSEVAEPWDYTSRGVELLRFEYVARKAMELNPQKGPLLDVGCALGQLTHRLLNASNEIHAIDISLTAVRNAKQKCASLPGGAEIHFACASATDLPYVDEYFDLVIFSDGLEGWELSTDQRLKALAHAFRVVKPGGYVLLTDYLHPRDFKKHIELIKSTAFRLKKVDYLCDRVGFQITNNLRGIKTWPGVRQLLSHVGFMKLLAQLSRPWGSRASKHLAMVLQKP
jgi:ubiquinone/menaquinone biosynthesis C-methylase UbiE